MGKHILMLLAVLWFALVATLSADVTVPAHEILITVPIGVKGNLVAEKGDTIWDTINRYFDEQGFQYKNGDEIHLKITPKKGEVYYMYGCVTGGELIISANNPRFCP